MVAQFTTKTTNSKKAIYFLQFMSYSINKLMFHMLFMSKIFVFSDLTMGASRSPPPCLTSVQSPPKYKAVYMVTFEDQS